MNGEFDQTNHLVIGLDAWADLIIRELRDLGYQEDFPLQKQAVLLTSSDLESLDSSQTGQIASVKFLYANLLDRINSLQEYDTTPLRVYLALNVAAAHSISKAYEQLVLLCGILRVMERQLTIPHLNITLFSLINCDIETQLKESEGQTGHTTSNYVKRLRDIFDDLQIWEYLFRLQGSVNLGNLLKITRPDGSIGPGSEFDNMQSRGRIIDQTYILSVPMNKTEYNREETDHIAHRIFQDIAHPAYLKLTFRGYLGNLPIDTHTLVRKLTDTVDEEDTPSDWKDRWEQHCERWPQLKNCNPRTVAGQQAFSTLATAIIQKPLKYLAEYFSYQSINKFYETYFLNKQQTDPIMLEQNLHLLFEGIGFESSGPPLAGEEHQYRPYINVYRLVEDCYCSVGRKYFQQPWFYGHDPYEYPEMMESADGLANFFRLFLQGIVSSAELHKGLRTYLHTEIQNLPSLVHQNIDDLLDSINPQFNFASLEYTLDTFHKGFLEWFTGDKYLDSDTQKEEAGSEQPNNTDESDENDTETDQTPEEQACEPALTFARQLEDAEARYRQDFQIHLEALQSHLDRDNENIIMRFLLRFEFFRNRRFIHHLRDFSFVSLYLAEISAVLLKQLNEYNQQNKDRFSESMHKIFQFCRDFRNPETKDEKSSQKDESLSDIFHFIQSDEDKPDRPEIKALEPFFLAPSISFQYQLALFLDRARRLQVYAQHRSEDIGARTGFRLSIPYGFKDIDQIKELYDDYYTGRRMDEVNLLHTQIYNEFIQIRRLDLPQSNEDIYPELNITGFSWSFTPDLLILFVWIY